MNIKNVTIKGSKSHLCYRVESLEVTETALEFGEFPMYCPGGENQTQEGHRYALVPAAIIPIERDPDYDLEFMIYFKIGPGVTAQNRYLEDSGNFFDINLENDGAVLFAGVIPSRASGREITIDVIEVNDEQS